MDNVEIMDLSSDNEGGEVRLMHQRSCSHSNGQISEESIGSIGPNACHNNSGVLAQGSLLVDDKGLFYSSPICTAPVCWQFWKAGNYDNGLGSTIRVTNVENYLHVHPLFLHSNATSHKWIFGALAELLDNAVDEIQNGATYVNVDKILNPKNRSPALLIQDDGGGMDPEAMRRCMSFGFSDKKSKLGQYGNGFKAGTMRLGADVIVFSCHLNNSILTRSIGLLSYTYLMGSQLDRIVVPMVSYEFDTSTKSLKILNSEEHFITNLSMLLKWSPYSSETELLKQFEDIESHGTKIIIYNLWFNDDGNLELDFDMDPEDICIAGGIKINKKVDTPPTWKTIHEQHIANRFQYSLRVYLSILYLQLPESFRIILRGQVVKLHNIADDLKYREYILYKPHHGSSDEAKVVTTIGFLKEAPEVNIHGFNVYHKKRLILPFWQVVTYTNSRGRGVVGVLQADFVEPTHNKQDFERTSLFQKLEVRLKEMTWEYWDCHCQLIGYQGKIPRSKVSSVAASLQKPPGTEKTVASNKSSCTQSRSEQASLSKRMTDGSMDLQKTKRQARDENISTAGCNNENEQTTASPVDQKTINLMQKNKELRAECLQYEKAEEELHLMVTQLRSKIREARLEYNRLLAESQLLDMKPGCGVDMPYAV